MDFLNQVEGFARLDALGASGADFFFLISYDRERILAAPLNELPDGLRYRLGSWSGEPPDTDTPFSGEKDLYIEPIPYRSYAQALERIKEEIRRGNTYLLNLTFPSLIETTLSLEEIYRAADAPYKLLLPEQFVCFSPEKFITIQKNRIYTYPMKGTIDATLSNAAEKILADPKEMAEHVMITDLMRNDLNRISEKVRVEKFRYLDKIHAGEKELYQVSSEIVGELGGNWRSRIGSILREITPAGSISGTPKKKTLQIIKEVEGYDRGFYTGIFGVCKGEELRSAVLIRFVEKSGKGLVYKSGGGITIDSDPLSEYRELLEKIYFPF
ncbi:Chorismate binding protein [Nitratifractor salsuginis DSM 16511]|uniref:Chorismate binding protein n=2 Tax=Nitratifractor salsuginis TaxID=269261 RepID=E6WZH3_NITSE|nr:Chorismate binding protein [Nitratifractor salsuginis DSM 16511]